MKKIWKFSLDIINRQEIEMPEGAVILTAQLQNGDLKLWALVDPGKKDAKRIIRVIGTGHDIALVDLHYISSFQIPERDFVFHIFEELK